MKKCPDCGELKPFDLFQKRRSSKDGLQSYCRPCSTIRKREYNQNDTPEKKAERAIAEERAKLLSSCSLKECSVCGIEKHENAFYRSAREISGRASCCKDCQDKQNALIRQKNPSNAARISRNTKLKLKFGLTPEDLVALIKAQEGKCKICGGYFLDLKACIDHDHETGKIRGVLCNQCNTGLGLFKDSPARLIAAAAYLQKTP